MPTLTNVVLPPPRRASGGGHVLIVATAMSRRPPPGPMLVLTAARRQCPAPALSREPTSAAPIGSRRQRIPLCTANLGSSPGPSTCWTSRRPAFQRSGTTSPVLCSVTATTLPSRARGGRQNDPARRTPGSGAGPRAVTGPPPRPGCQHPRLTCGSSSCDQPAGPGMGCRTGCSRRPPGPGWVPGRHRPAVPRS
jgi:hypothetical protein